MDIFDKAESVLRNTYIIFENISFRRTDNIVKRAAFTSNFSKNVYEVEDEEGKYKVSIKLDIEAEDGNFELSITVSGGFEVIGCDDENTKKGLLNGNAVAILFPYLRSEVTLLTSQPCFSSINMPPINITKLINELEEEGKINN